MGCQKQILCLRGWSLEFVYNQELKLGFLNEVVNQKYRALPVYRNRKISANLSRSTARSEAISSGYKITTEKSGPYVHILLGLQKSLENDQAHRVSVSDGSISMDSTTLRRKIFRKKSRKLQNANLKLSRISSYLHIIHILFTAIHIALYQVL